MPLAQHTQESANRQTRIHIAEHKETGKKSRQRRPPTRRDGVDTWSQDGGPEFSPQHRMQCVATVPTGLRDKQEPTQKSFGIAKRECQLKLAELHSVTPIAVEAQKTSGK